jgi:predicted nucleotidyltransferase
MESFQNNLEKSILSTVAYFDILDYPLTVVEIWKWLYRISDLNSQSFAKNIKSKIEEGEISLAEVKKILDNSEILKSLVENRRGFYFLKNRGNLLATRQTRYVLAEKKIRKAKWIAGFLKFLPGVKMIALCNSLAWTNAKEESDIDFFIVTARNKIWTTRFLAAGFLQMFGLRPLENKTKNKICLSFFADEDSLNLEPLALNQLDVYLIYWVAQLVPLYDREEIYQKFWQANTWVKNFLPNVFQRDAMAASGKRRPAGKADAAEKIFRRIQIKMLPKKLKEMANRDSQVVITDKILKFHVNDRREEYREKWLKRISELGI